MTSHAKFCDDSVTGKEDSDIRKLRETTITTKTFTTQIHQNLALQQPSSYLDKIFVVSQNAFLVTKVKLKKHLCHAHDQYGRLGII